MERKIEQLQRNAQTEKIIGKKQRNLKFKNKYNEENPKKFKALIKLQKEKN